MRKPKIFDASKIWLKGFMEKYKIELSLFKCEICQRSFRVRDSLDMHTKSFHEPNVKCEIDDTFQSRHKFSLLSLINAE